MKVKRPYVGKFYPNNYYEPMPEQHSESIPVTRGCSYNKCLYCDLNQGTTFKIFPLEMVKAYIDERAEYYKDKFIVPKKFVMMGGNPLVVQTDHLLEIIGHVKKRFPQMTYISSFARADDILKKSDEDLLKLHQAGLDRLCIGVESGSDEVLKFMEKGLSSRQQKEAMDKLERLGISYTCYIMLGLGGRKRSVENARATGRFLNSVNPLEIVVVTTVLFAKAPLVEKVRNKEFDRMSVYESVYEEKVLLENLELDTIFNGSHNTNAIPIKGKLPEQKDLLIKKINTALEEFSDSQLVQEARRKWAKDNWQ